MSQGQCRLITVYEAYTKGSTFARIPDHSLGFFSSESAAREAADKGCGGDVRKNRAIETPVGTFLLASEVALTIYDSVADKAAHKVIKELDLDTYTALKRRLEK